MKALRIIVIVVLSLGLIGGAGYLWASSGVKSKPGYVERFSNDPLLSIDDLTSDGDKPIKAMFAMNLGPSGITPVRWVIEKVVNQADRVLETSERVLLGLVKEIQGVQLRIYEVKKNRKVFDSAITYSTAELKQQSWQPLIKVQDGEEHVVVMQFGDDQQIAAISIMASTPENAVFLNLIGPFDPEKIAASATQVH